MWCYIRDPSSRVGLKGVIGSFVSFEDVKAAQTTERSRWNIRLYQKHHPSSHRQSVPALTRQVFLQPGHTHFIHVCQNVPKKPEKQCQLPWSSKHDSSSRTVWEAPPAPKRKLKHPKTHLRTRRAPFNHQVLPVTFPSNQVIQSHFTGWTSLSFKWTGAFAPRPFPNLCCLRVSNSLLISSLNIFPISSRVSLYLQQHGPLKLGSLSPPTISLCTTSSLQQTSSQDKSSWQCPSLLFNPAWI